MPFVSQTAQGVLAGSGGGGGSLFGFFGGAVAPISAAIGAGLGAVEQISRSSQQIKQGQEAVKALDEQIKAARIKRTIDTVALAEAAQSAVGRARLGLIAQTSSAAAEVAGHQARQVAASQNSIDTQTENIIEDLMRQRETVIMSVNSAQTPPIFGALKGALGFFAAGAQVQGAINANRNASEMSKIMKPMLRWREEQGALGLMRHSVNNSTAWAALQFLTGRVEQEQQYLESLRARQDAFDAILGSANLGNRVAQRYASPVPNVRSGSSVFP
jgi:hypothetical protein